MAKIVIIDDDALMCNMIIETLAEKGHETFSALDGRAGIALIENKLPDLVISDIMMPELDGYQCLELIRSNSRIDTIPVILLSGINEFGAIRKGMVLGADDYLVKPFSHEDLSAAVETQLKKRALIRNHHETTLSLLRKNIVYSLPHEFRTPLQLIMGHGHLLDMTYNSATPVDIQESARVIVSAGKRLQRLIENCLVYTQLELADEKEKLALRNHVLRDSANVITEVARARAEKYQRLPDLTLELSKTALRISEDDLRKIVDELVDNALKFSEPGSQVVIKSSYHDSTYTLTIEDHGRGMTDEQIKNMGAYMQFDRALFEQQGLGLGFTIARRLVELHEGKLDISSTPNVGTLIKICFKA